MQSMTVNWSDGRGWSRALPPSLDSHQTLVLVFGPAALLALEEPLRDLRRTYPRAVIVGAASATVVDTNLVLETAIAVSITRFDATVLAVHVDDGEDGYRCGRRFAAAFASPPGIAAPLRAVIMLAHGLSMNGPELVRGLSEPLDEAVVLSGGMTGDGGAASRPWVCTAQGRRSSAAIGIGLYGERLQVRSACRGGSVGFGPKRRVTQSDGHTIYELDARPALALYELFLGDYAVALPAAASHFPLTVFRHENDRSPVIRYVLSIDRAAQSITVAGTVPRGSLVQLSRTSRGELLRAAEQIAGTTTPIDPAAHDAGTLSLMVSCVGRRVVLGEQTEEEIEAVANALGDGACRIGFYSYGEIAGAPGVARDMHNMTLALTTFRES